MTTKQKKPSTELAPADATRSAFVDRDDDALADEIRKLEEELKRFRDQNIGRQRDRAHRRLDELIAGRRAAWEASVRKVRRAAVTPGDGLGMLSLNAELYVWTLPEVAEQLHAAIDMERDLPGEVPVEFTDMSEVEYAERLRTLREEIAAREGELEIREARREVVRIAERVQRSQEDRARKAAA